MQTTAAQDRLRSGSETAAGITARVRALYERWPYPHYPLFAKPRWQEGWLTASRFSAALAGFQTGTGTAAKRKKILIAGCGEILPAVICANEPRSFRIDAVDLSKHSLRRAMFRCASQLTRLTLRQADVPEWFDRHPGTYDHIDCYGVLHHLADPIASLKRLAHSLTPGGTARIMVYNTPARSWIHQWQGVFRSLSFLPASADDIALAMRILKAAGEYSESLAGLLAQMGPSLLTSRTRFADTFLHPREARISPAAWTGAIAESGLTLTGIFDRYEECDDLPNPLWGITPETIISRVEDGLLQNNLELFLQREGGASVPQQTGRTPTLLTLKYFTPAPRAWWSSSETKDIPWNVRQLLWMRHREHIAGGNRHLSAALVNSLGTQSLRRLARMGAVLPGQLTEELRLLACQPMTGYPPAAGACAPNPARIAGAVTGLIESRCNEIKISPRRKKLLWLRLAAAMSPSRTDN